MRTTPSKHRLFEKVRAYKCNHCDRLFEESAKAIKHCTCKKCGRKGNLFNKWSDYCVKCRNVNELRRQKRSLKIARARVSDYEREIARLTVLVKR